MQLFEIVARLMEDIRIEISALQTRSEANNIIMATIAQGTTALLQSRSTGIIIIIPLHSNKNIF